MGICIIVVRVHTNEANIGNVIDPRAAIYLGKRRKQHRSGREAKNVDGDAKRCELLAV